MNSVAMATAAAAELCRTIIVLQIDARLSVNQSVSQITALTVDK